MCDLKFEYLRDSDAHTYHIINQECRQTVQYKMTEHIPDCTEHTKEFHTIKFWQLHSLLVVRPIYGVRAEVADFMLC